MKTALRYAVITFVIGFVVSLLVFLAAPTVFPGLLRSGSERFGEVAGGGIWFLTFMAFIGGWIRQANRKERNSPPATS